MHPLYLGLIGLVPKPLKVDDLFANDIPNAHEKTVDRLFASPHYGARTIVFSPLGFLHLRLLAVTTLLGQILGFAWFLVLMTELPHSAAQSEAPTPTLEDTPTRHQVEFGNAPREYFVRLPEDYDSSKRYWALVTVHGGGGNGRNHFLAKTIRAIADEAGLEAIVISPSFSNEDFQASRFPTLGEGPFLIKALEDVATHYRIREKVLLTGYSRGGQFSHRFAFEHPDKVAAVAPFSAGTWTTPDGRLLIESYGEVKDPESFLSNIENQAYVPERLWDLFSPRVASVAGLKPQLEATQVPFLVMCGSLDTRFEISKQFAESLRNSGFSVETEWPRTPHGGKTNPEYESEFRRYSSQAVAFFLQATNAH